MRGFMLAALVSALLFSVNFLQSQTVFAADQNLFSNASAETSQGQLPQAWSKDQWGGTRATFTYSSGSAKDGNRFLTTTVTKKGRGDAKWYPTHVAVTPGQTYTFSDWYKSDAKSGIDIEYILTNGSYRYVHLAAPATTGEWKKFEKTFVVPVRAKKLTVLHYLDRVGTLSVDNYSLVVGTTSEQTTTPPSATSSVTVNNSPIPTAQNVLTNVANQPLGGFVVEVSTQPASMSSISFFVATSSTGPGLITNVTLVHSNGTVYAGPVDAVYDSASGKQKITFNDLVTFPVGTSTFMLKGKLPASFINDGTLIASTNPAQQWVSSTSLQNSIVAMNTMTVKTASLTISMSATPATNNLAAGAQAYDFAHVQLDASQSAEDVRTTSIPLSFAGAIGDLSGCQLWDGATVLNTGSRIVNAVSTVSANTFTLDNTLVITKGTTKTLAIKCNVSGAAVNGSTYQFGVNNSYAYSATGVTSGNTVTPLVTTGNGQIMTVANGVLSLSVDPSSPAYKVVAGGSTGVTVGTTKLRANNEAMTLNKIGFNITSGSSEDISQLYVYDGATLVGTAIFVSGNTTATSTLSTPVALAQDTDRVLTIKADIAAVGIGHPGHEGDLLKIDPLNAEAVGGASGTVLKANGNSTTAGVRIVKSYPTISLATLPNAGVVDGRLIRFSATANATGAVGMHKFTFAIATSSVMVTNLQLFAFIDSGYTNPIAGQGVSGQIGLPVAGVPNDTTVTFITQTNAQQIPAGTTIYYELHGDVADVDVNSLLTTTLKGDAAFDGMKQANAVSGNLVWSPNATTTSAFMTNDWTNGYALPGLPAAGLTQNRIQ